MPAGQHGAEEEEEGGGWPGELEQLRGAGGGSIRGPGPRPAHSCGSVWIRTDGTQHPKRGMRAAVAKSRQSEAELRDLRAALASPGGASPGDGPGRSPTAATCTALNTL